VLQAQAATRRTNDARLTISAAKKPKPIQLMTKQVFCTAPTIFKSGHSHPPSPPCLAGRSLERRIAAALFFFGADARRSHPAAKCAQKEKPPIEQSGPGSGAKSVGGKYGYR